jgi:hypothetical protein
LRLKALVIQYAIDIPNIKPNTIHEAVDIVLMAPANTINLIANFIAGLIRIESIKKKLVVKKNAR